MGWGRGVGALVAALAAPAMIGCAIVDEYSGRAVVYNVQAEQAQNQALLLNVVRAVQRRPMQFTTVSSITGTASSSSSAQYTLPTRVPFRPSVNGSSIAAFPPVPTWQLSTAMSGGPTFTVPVLDTQEFYQGIMRPLPGQIWDLFIQFGYSRPLLFNLFVEKVVMRREDCPKLTLSNGEAPRCEFEFENYVTNELKVALFQALGDYLLAYGLTTEAAPQPTVPLRGFKNVNVRYIGAVDPKDNKKAQLAAPPGGAAAPAGDSPAHTYRLCFSPSTARYFPKHNKCGGDGPGGAEAELVANKPSRVTIELRADFISRLDEIIDAEMNDRKRADDLKAELSIYGMKNAKVKLVFSLRSVEGMIYYLGELGRRQLNPDAPPRTAPAGPVDPFVYVKVSRIPYDRYPPSFERCAHDIDDCKPIFVLREGLPDPDAVVSILYEGRLYSVPSAQNFKEAGFSSQVLDILRQLIALNSSAKSLPQSTLISVVGQ